MKKALLLISLLVAVCATTTPAQKRQDGSVTINTSTLKAVEGYFGPTPIIIHLDSHEKVSGIEFLPNDETPSYWQMAVEKLSHAWDGVPADKVSTLKVDAVTSRYTLDMEVYGEVRQRVLAADSTDGEIVQFRLIEVLAEPDEGSCVVGVHHADLLPLKRPSFRACSSSLLLSSTERFRGWFCCGFGSG